MSQSTEEVENKHEGDSLKPPTESNKIVEEDVVGSSNENKDQKEDIENLKKKELERKRKRRKKRIKKAKKTFKRALFHVVQTCHPDARVFTIRNIVLLVSSVYNFLVVSFRMTFLFPLENFRTHMWFFYVVLGLDIILDLFNTFDIILSLFTPFYNSKGFTVSDPKKILKSYLSISSNFPVDVASILPLDYIYLIVILCIFIFSKEVDCVRLLRYSVFFRVVKFVKLVRFLRYFSHIESKSYTFKVHPAVIRVIKYFLLVFLISHLFACIWYIVTITEDEQKSLLWSEIATFQSRSVWEHYLFAFHWVYVKITGYGGTVPASFYETVYCFFVVLCGIIVNISIVGLVSSVIGNYLEEGTEKRQNFERIKLYINYKGIKGELKKRILTYYTFTFENNRQWNEREILADLPDYLRSELAISIYSTIIKKVDLFKNASQSFVAAVVQQLDPRVSLPNEVIIRRGDVGREMFFLTRGSVEVIVKGKVVAELKEGSYFGEVALLKRATRNATVRASTFCDLYVLTKSAFEELENSFPVEFEVIRKLAKEREVEEIRKQSVRNLKALRAMRKNVGSMVKNWRKRKKPILTKNENGNKLEKE